MNQFEQLHDLFPELSEKEQQTIKGGFQYDYDYYAGWLHNVTITNGGSNSDNPYTYGDWYRDFGQYHNPDNQYNGGGGGYEGGGDAYTPHSGPTFPGVDFYKDFTFPSWREIYGVELAQTLHSTLEGANNILEDVAEISGRFGGSTELAAKATGFFTEIGKGLTEFGHVSMAFDVYNSVVAGKFTAHEATKFALDLGVGKLSNGVPIAGPALSMVYTALDATGHVDTFITWVLPEQMDDKPLMEIFNTLQYKDITNLTFQELFGREVDTSNDRPTRDSGHSGQPTRPDQPPRSGGGRSNRP
jgi:hypothetical protein